MSREKESAGWSAGRLASWRLSSNDVHVHVSYGPYGPYLLPPMLRGELRLRLNSR